MELVSQREYARRRGISHVAVQRAIKAGRISAVDGKVNPEQADREWVQNTDLSKPLNRITGDPKRGRPAGKQPEAVELAGEGKASGGGSGYAKARATREIYQAQLARLELERQQGILVRADEVRAAAFDAHRRTRDHLITLPERIAAIVAATTDPAEVQRILDDEIERICHELSSAEWA